MANASLPPDNLVNTFDMNGFGGTIIPVEPTTTCVITKADRIRLGNVDTSKSLTQNFTTIIDVYENTIANLSQVGVASSCDTMDVEQVIERALAVLCGKELENEL